MNSVLIINPPFLLKNSLSLKWRIVLRLFWTTGILSIIALLAFYVFQVNAEISERYSIKKYENILNQSLKENKKLELNSLQFGSLENMDSIIASLNFEKVDKVSYIRVLNGQVVSNKK